MLFNNNWAVVIPMANEEKEFDEFIRVLRGVMDELGEGIAYLVIDKISIDRTFELCRNLSQKDQRFVTVWAPENRNVVDAYMRGYLEAFKQGHEIIIEMDSGLSHDPKALPVFLKVLKEKNICAFGSRFIEGGTMEDASIFRKILSRGGTVVSNFLLGTRFHDMTSGYQGFHRDVVSQLLKYPLRSKAHFYQTEVRYLLRKRPFVEIPIHYRAPSPRVSKKAILNSLSVLIYYFKRRLLGKSIEL